MSQVLIILGLTFCALISGVLLGVAIADYRRVRPLEEAVTPLPAGLPDDNWPTELVQVQTDLILAGARANPQDAINILGSCVLEMSHNGCIIDKQLATEAMNKLISKGIEASIQEQ